MKHKQCNIQLQGPTPFTICEVGPYFVMLRLVLSKSCNETVGPTVALFREIYNKSYSTAGAVQVEANLQ